MPAEGACMVYRRGVCLCGPVPPRLSGHSASLTRDQGGVLGRRWSITATGLRDVIMADLRDNVSQLRETFGDLIHSERSDEALQVAWRAPHRLPDCLAPFPSLTFHSRSGALDVAFARVITGGCGQRGWRRWAAP